MSIGNLFKSEYLTHVSNYSGDYQAGVDYKKFDFVYYTGDGLFYYARQDAVDGAGIFIQDNNRLSLIPDGPMTSDGQSHYILDTFNLLDAPGAEIKVGHLLNIDGSTGNNDGIYKVIDVKSDVSSLNGNPDLNGSVINVLPVEGSFKNLEPAGPNELTITAINAEPSDNTNVWTHDEFFFDADYGSTVNFRANNYKYEYGNGYYILQPKNINSLNIEVDLKFKNRTNREANAIVHFLENHQGQHEQDIPSPNLKYSQGISGFQWDGDSTFHPYDNTEVQSKTFYCSDWTHNLNFENDNDISVKLRNLDTSILKKLDGLFVADIDEYSDSEYYEKNDIVYNVENKKFYYWYGDQSYAGKNPTATQAEWNRNYGYHLDINTDCWSRKFFWKPSLTLSVSQKPRLNEIGMGAGYSQIYRDGINESLLTLELNFNNRDDAEARAILHFLEQHYGAIPFQFNPPAPYERLKNFVCQEWTHTYNYKNNHSISARFEQYPIEMSASQVDNIITPIMPIAGELLCESPVQFSIQGVGEEIKIDDRVKKRMYAKNGGDETIDVDAMVFYNDNVEFSILTQNGNADISMIIEDDLIADDFIFTLPPDTSLPFDLANKTVRMSKSYTEGLAGGEIFTVVRPDGDRYLTDTYNGVANKFFQNNRGVITSMARSQLGMPDYFAYHPKFLVEQFIENNKTNKIPAGKTAYWYVVFEGENKDRFVGVSSVNQESGSLDDIVFVDEIDAEFYASSIPYDQGYGSLLAISNSSVYRIVESLVNIYISS